MALQQLIARLLPFLIIGIGLVVAFFGVLLLSSLLLWGAIIGTALFVVTRVIGFFFPPKRAGSPEQNKTARKGRIIEYDDLDKE